MSDNKIYSIPLAKKDLIEILNNKISDFTDNHEGIYLPVKYSECSIKDNLFLNYIGNLKIPVELDLDDTLDTEIKIDLMKNFMTNSQNPDIVTLTECLAIMLLEEEGIDTLDEKLWLNKKERKIFRSQNRDLIDPMVSFFKSFLVGMPYLVKEYEAGIGANLIKDNKVELIDDPDCVSKSLINLFLLPNFMETYLGIIFKNKNLEYKYYLRQMNDPIYRGKDLVSILTATDSTIFSFLALFMDTINPTEHSDKKANTKMKQYIEETMG